MKYNCGLRRTQGTLIRNFMVLHILRQPLVFPRCVNPFMILRVDFTGVHFVSYPDVMCSVCFVIGCVSEVIYFTGSPI